MDSVYVTARECMERHKEVDKRLGDGDTKFGIIESQLKSLVSTCKIIAGAAVSGVVMIIVTLLLK